MIVEVCVCSHALHSCALSTQAMYHFVVLALALTLIFNKFLFTFFLLHFALPVFCSILRCVFSSIESLARSLRGHNNSYVYPTMDELAAQLLFVLSHFGLKSIIGFGVGAGANILARFALNHSDKVGALCLINCSSTTSGWMEWGYQSFNAR